MMGFAEISIWMRTMERINNGDKYVIRLKLPENADLTFHDHVRGDVTF